MKLLINNLGPIRNNTTTIDLSKQFYVFVGANNSGKTYVSQFLWGIYFYCHTSGFRQFINEQDMSFIKILDNNTIRIDDVFLQKTTQIYIDYLQKKLADLYNAYDRNSFLPPQIALDLEDEMILALELRVSVGFSKNKYSFFKKKGEKYITIQNEGEAFLDDAGIQMRIIFSFIRRLFQHQTNKFLPANRQFYPIFYQYIFQLERKNNFDDDLISDESSTNKLEKPYTKPIDRLLEDLFSISLQESKNNFHVAEIAKLAAIMGGDIATNRVEGIGMANFRFEINEAKNIPLYLASSSVNQLTLLYLYFKYWAGKGRNILFIDEPEENLHPHNQLKLLELLIAFSSQNQNKVFINTHSPLLAEALNNYMYLYSLKHELGMTDEEIKMIVAENGLKFIDIEIAIPKEKVGVYFFDGEKIIDYETDSYGVFFRDFKEVTNSISKANRIFTDYLYLSQQAIENA